MPIIVLTKIEVQECVRGWMCERMPTVRVFEYRDPRSSERKRPNSFPRSHLPIISTDLTVKRGRREKATDRRKKEILCVESLKRSQ